jgi:hypothetical protein
VAHRTKLQQSLHDPTRAQLAMMVPAQHWDVYAFESLETVISSPPGANGPNRYWLPQSHYQGALSRLPKNLHVANVD